MLTSRTALSFARRLCAPPGKCRRTGEPASEQTSNWDWKRDDLFERMRLLAFLRTRATVRKQRNGCQCNNWRRRTASHTRNWQSKQLFLCCRKRMLTLFAFDLGHLSSPLFRRPNACWTLAATARRDSLWRPVAATIIVWILRKSCNERAAAAEPLERRPESKSCGRRKRSVFRPFVRSLGAARRQLPSIAEQRRQQVAAQLELTRNVAGRLTR